MFEKFIWVTVGNYSWFFFSCFYGIPSNKYFFFFFWRFTHSPVDGHLGSFLVWGVYKYEHLSSLLFFNVLTLEDREV